MGFANPLALAFAGLFAVLVALYLWERRDRRVDVPSLLLWQSIPEAAVRNSRFRPDLLFFLQALLLALLIAGFAQPFFSGRAASAPARNIFVLDVSASMQAREAKGTRFALARRALRERVASLPDGSESMLVAAGDVPWVAAESTTDRAEVLRRLDDLEATDCGADLNLAIALAHRAAERTDAPARIDVYTDLPPSRLAPAWRSEVGIHQIGETDDNLAIEGLQVLQGRFQTYQEARAHVTIRNHSHREQHGFLTVQVEDETVMRRGFSLAPGALRGFPIERLPRPGVLHAELDVDDALAADNQAWEWVRPVGPLHVLVVSDRSRLETDLGAIARATPNLEFRFLSPAEYESAPISADVVVMDRYVAEKPPDAATLYVAPARGNALFKVEGRAGDVPVLDWNEEHPAVRGLRPALAFPLRHAAILSLGPSLENLLTGRAAGRDIPLAFAGEVDGHRVAGLSFDLGEERLFAADNVDLLLLFLNLLDWLAPADPAVALVRTGSVEVIEGLPDVAPRVVDPHGRSWTVPRGQPVSIETRWAGEYRVLADGTSRRVLASLIDPVESDIGRTAERVSSQSPIVGGGGVPSSAATFAPWLYLAAAALFFFEWMVARLRS